MHAWIDKTYEYHADSGRFQPRDLLGPAAETLDVLHAAKAEQAETAKKIASGSPDDLFDAAESLATNFSKLAEGALAPQRLIPSYRQLVNEAKPPLPPEARELALDFGTNPDLWNQLLKRPFPTLKADGPFVLERAEVDALVVDRLGSLGDPPRTLKLNLLRFRLEGIDTGGKVIAARREGDREPVNSPYPAADPSPALEAEPGSSRSPGAPDRYRETER